MRYKILIIDDNEADIHKIRNNLAQILPSFHHTYDISWCNNPEKSGSLYSFDIYIIDIHMHTGTYGFELAKSINEVCRNVSIIFCTNYENLVFDSWRINALFFVRKNHLKNDLKDAMVKFEAKLPKEKWITVLESHHSIRIPLFRTVYVEAYRNNLIIHMTDTTTHEIYSSLKRFLSLSECADFIQISRSTAVNSTFISDLSGSMLTVNRNIRIPVSRRRLPYVRECFLTRSAKNAGF